MKPVYKNLLISGIGSLTLGILTIVPVVNSENGYVAGFIFLPLFFLTGFCALALFIAGLVITIKEKGIGPYLILASICLPVGFFTGAAVSKHFELGSYREDPMVPIISEISNIVILKKGVSNDEISEFWNTTLSTQRDDNRGYDNLPGVRDIGRMPDRNGQAVIEFGFFQSVIQEQKDFVYSRVRSSPIIDDLLIDVPTKDFMLEAEITTGDKEVGEGENPVLKRNEAR